MDAALGWHGSTLRVGSMVVVRNRVLSKTLGLPADEHLVTEMGLPWLRAALKVRRRLAA